MIALLSTTVCAFIYLWFWVIGSLSEITFNQEKAPSFFWNDYTRSSATAKANPQRFDGFNYNRTNGSDANHGRPAMTEHAMGACLLVMDDNHFLIEWVAYHYHVLPLRRLIVAMDPRSKTSPHAILDRWHDRIQIDLWTDEDYGTIDEWEEAEFWAALKFRDTAITPLVIRHRARQRLFYYHCLQTLKAEGRGWTVLIDSDEFLRINYETVKQFIGDSAVDSAIRDVPPITEPGSVLTFLKHEIHRRGTNLTSPCVQIPRLRFGAKELDTVGSYIIAATPTSYGGWNTSLFQTLRYQWHARPGNFVLNRISKVIIDLTRIPTSDLVPVESIHRPLKDHENDKNSMCKRRLLHIRTPEQVLVIHHYSGTYEQYIYRDDARVGKERSPEVRLLLCLVTLAPWFSFLSQVISVAKFIHSHMHVFWRVHCWGADDWYPDVCKSCESELGAIRCCCRLAKRICYSRRVGISPFLVNERWSFGTTDSLSENHDQRHSVIECHVVPLGLFEVPLRAPRLNTCRRQTSPKEVKEYPQY